MALIGYARVSTLDQDYKLQMDALENKAVIRFSLKRKVLSPEPIEQSLMNACATYVKVTH